MLYNQDVSTQKTTELIFFTTHNNNIKKSKLGLRDGLAIKG